MVARGGGTLSWVCGFALTSKAENIPAAYALMNSQSSPEAQAIRAEDGYWSPTPRRSARAARLPGAAGVETADEAIPETHPDDYPAWVRAFQDFNPK